MSLDLLKNALYQAFKASMPSLVMYPEHVDNTYETFPNLSFIDLKTEHLPARVGLEWVEVPNPAYPGASTAQNLTIPVIARKVSHLKLQYRDSLGGGTKDHTAYQKIRDQHNAIDRFLTNTSAVYVGSSSPSQLLAQLWYEGDRSDYDPVSSIFLHEYDVRIDPWRLLDGGPGNPTYLANSIELDVVRESDNRILITRLYPLS